MPRRHPKKPPKDLDLSRNLRILADLESPLDPTTLFCQSGPVELEVGTGKGMFLTSVTSASPDRNFLGIEVSAGDAMHLVRHSLPNASLSGVHVYFPDPWWKARHRKRRILNPEFLEHAGRIMQSGSQLHIWTDVEEYFHEATSAVDDTSLFDQQSDESPGGPETTYRTHFERRTRLAGAPVWRAVFGRNETPPQKSRLIAKRLG